MVFTLRLLQEKSIEQNKSLNIMFTDLPKAFDSVSRTGLYNVMERIRNLPKLLQMISAFHNGMTARVVFDGDISESFNIRCEVKQGCVTAPTLFSICLSILLFCAFLSTDVIVLHTRHDRNRFNSPHLRAKTKTDTVLICKLLFDKHMVSYAHSLPKMQGMCDAFSASCNLFSLEISTKKMITFATNGPPPCTQINGVSLVTVHQFCYLGSTIARTVTINTEVPGHIIKQQPSLGNWCHMCGRINI